MRGGGWFYFCLAWAAVGAATLGLLDHTFTGGMVWLLTGLLIGCFGEFFVERFIEIFPGDGGSLLFDPFSFPPSMGLCHGTLVGPFVGVVIASDSGRTAGLGALLGGLLGPPCVALLYFVVCGVAAVAKPDLAARDDSGTPLLSWTHRALLVGMALALPLVAGFVLLRCLAWIPRRRRRLRLYDHLRRLGGVFTRDPAGNRFFGINFDYAPVSDAELKQLRVFPELDQLILSRTRVTDAGVAHLRCLKHLKLLYLADTAITDAALAHLADIRGLEILDLSWTRVGNVQLERLGKLRRLKHLGLTSTLITEEGVHRLLAIRPGLDVRW